MTHAEAVAHLINTVADKHDRDPYLVIQHFATQNVAKDEEIARLKAAIAQMGGRN